MNQNSEILKNSQKYFSWIINKPIAHRGLHNLNGTPENSISAFEKAIELNIPIELDLKLTKDEKLIVFHDENFERMNGYKADVNVTSWDDIKELKLRGTNEKIPLFKDVLELVRNRVPLLIELKNFGRAGKFEQIVKETLKNYDGEYAIQSFNPLSIRWLKINAPEILRGQIASRFKDEQIPRHYKYLLKNLTFNLSTKPDFINYNIDDLPYLPVGLLRKQGIPVLGWTVKNESQLRKAKQLCDNFVFEDLEPAKVI